MPKASKVGKFRAAARATSRDVRVAPLTAQYLAQVKGAIKGAIKGDAPAVAGSDAPKPEEKEPLSRGQRKRLAKREQYLKREKMVMSSLRLKRLEEQKGKLDGLDAIREALGESLSPSKSIPEAAKEMPKKNPTSCRTNKSKKTLANAEISHMGLVLQHPSFKENPFAAIQQHLRNSLAPDAEKLKEESLKRDEEDGKLEAKRKEERKERIRDAKFSRKKRGSRAFKTSRANRI